MLSQTGWLLYGSCEDQPLGIQTQDTYFEAGRVGLLDNPVRSAQAPHSYQRCERRLGAFARLSDKQLPRRELAARILWVW